MLFGECLWRLSLTEATIDAVAPYLSVVIPAYNEEGSLQALVERLLPVLAGYGRHEIIFVNDGSTDSTPDIMEALRRQHPDVIGVISLRRNCGKALALQAGFSKARGAYVAMMDSDLQDQPEELPKLMALLENGTLDAVTGWKKTRHDPVLAKNIPSKFFNWMLRRASGIDVHDFNCGLKAFRRECLESVILYGQLHRFLLVLVAHLGFRVGEIAIEHAPRRHGVSKFGASRFYHGFMDLMSVYFLTRCSGSPLHFFGIYGSLAIFVSMPIAIFYFTAHLYGYFYNKPHLLLPEHPAWIISPVMFLLGLMMLFFGLIAEMLVQQHTLPRHFAPFVEKDTDVSPPHRP